MFENGRISARPRPIDPPGPPGESRLHLEARRDSLLYVPAVAAAGQPAPLVLPLHGAGGEARHGLDLLKPWADQAGLILLAPASRGQTWDVILGGYGPDVEVIDRSLDSVFRRFRIDPDRIAMGGFSDGASYALSLGLINGDLFTHVLAFSPGFMAPHVTRGRPRVFISHGLGDTVLPIDRCSRVIVPRLRREGYAVEYAEFDGGHVLPPEMARAAVDWFGQPAGGMPGDGASDAP